MTEEGEDVTIELQASWGTFEPRSKDAAQDERIRWSRDAEENPAP